MKWVKLISVQTSAIQCDWSDKSKLKSFGGFFVVILIWKDFMGFCVSRDIISEPEHKKLHRWQVYANININLCLYPVKNTPQAELSLIFVFSFIPKEPQSCNLFHHKVAECCFILVLQQVLIVLWHNSAQSFSQWMFSTAR